MTINVAHAVGLGETTAPSRRTAWPISWSGTAVPLLPYWLGGPGASVKGGNVVLARG